MSATAPAAGRPPLPARSVAGRRLVNTAVTGSAWLAAAIGIFVMGWIVYTVFTRGIGAWNLAFFTQLPPVGNDPGGGLANCIIGTLVITFGAALVGLPLGIFGAILGGVIVVLIYVRRNKLSLPRYLDIAAPALLIGQAIGRWGNFVNQELYGPPTNLPWGIPIDAAHRYGDFADLTRYPVETTRFHPDFLYESILNVIGFIVLVIVARKFQRRLKDGDLILLYMIWYPINRILVESLRPDAWTVSGGLPTAQLISIILIVVAVGLLIVRHRPGRTAAAG